MISATPPPRRVLMTADTVGGVWTYAMELAGALKHYGIEVALASMGRLPSSAQRAQAHGLSNVTLWESQFKLEWMEDPWSDVERAGEWLLELEQKVKPDLVHLNSYTHGALNFYAPKLVVGHSCVLSWWRAVHGSDAPAEWDRYRQTVREGIQGADLVIAPSLSMLRCLEAHYGKLTRATLIHNGRCVPGLTPNAKHHFILAAGRIWDKAKNLSCLAAIAPRLGWPVFVAGEGDLHGEARANVRHLGCLQPAQLVAYFGRASIYALPAYYEPFGLSVLEAALGGCALVLGNIPSLRELWGEAALFVSPDSPNELRAAIEELIKDPELRWVMGERARTAAARFTPEAMAQGYLQAYASAARRAPACTEPEALAA